MNSFKLCAACVALLILCDAAGGAIGAAGSPGPGNAAHATIIPPAPRIEGTSFLLIDADTHRLLVENDIHLPVSPASLTKIMTSYVAAVELQEGRINLEDQVPISVKAWRTPGSRMFVREGTKVALQDLLRGIVIQSGNDASVAVAEHIAGSEDAFADMMNQQAVQLGMGMTQYHNATGLPSEGHQTSAWDLALLTLSLIERFPATYATYAERSFTYNDIEQPNRNRLLWRDRTVDGVKTGHTRAAGYCLVASAKRGNMRLISVVMGTSSEEARMRESQKLLTYGFRNFETQKLYDAGVPLKTSELWYGEAEDIELGVSEKVFVTIPRGRYGDLKAELKIARVIEAPVALGQEFGELRLLLNDKLVYSAPLVALAAVDEAGFFSRFGDGVYLLFRNMFSSD
ncbi:MAG: D-alanyl-D-alanine carboxypeptidase family protein [Pseudomonadales bacterium]